MIKLGHESMEGALQHAETTPSQTSYRLLFRAIIEVPSHYSKKNAKTIGYKWGRGKAFTSRGRRFTPFLRATNESAVAEQLLVQRLSCGERFSGADWPISVPMFGMFTFELDNFYTAKGEINRRAGDSSNLVQGVEDALQKAGVILDDALITDERIKRRFGITNRIIVELFTDDDAGASPKEKKRKKPNPRR